MITIKQAVAWAQDHGACGDENALHSFTTIEEAIAGLPIDHLQWAVGELGDQAWAEYAKIRDQAWAEYEKIRGQAWAEYVKIRDQAEAEYEKISDQALRLIVLGVARDWK